jgi:hypothetical protein
MHFLEIIMSEQDHDCDCDAQGPQGPQGIQGVQGVQGVQGPQGIQGAAGKDCCHDDHHRKCCDVEFAEVFSLLSQSLAPSPSANAPGQTVLFENTIFATSAIDVSMANSTGVITVNLSGWYDVVTGICGALNPIASPLPAWTFSMFRNGVIVPGSTFSDMTLSPEQKANEIIADVYLHLNAGDQIMVANTSTSTIVLPALSLGSNAQPNSAFMKISLLKAD